MWMEKGEEERDLDRIVAKHARYARANDLDPIHFAVVDNTDWEERGILFIKVTKDDAFDRFRRKGPTAGEMLNWIFIGLMTWEEAKNWDSSSGGKKRAGSVSDEGLEKSDDCGEYIHVNMLNNSWRVSINQTPAAFPNRDRILSLKV